MTENKLEGFEDFDNLLGGAEDGGGDDSGGLGGDLDDLLGDDGGGFGDEGGGGEGGESELDSFFEDLSTIDDLEVLQEDDDDEPDMAAEPADDEDGEPEVAAPVAAAQKREPKPKKEKKEGPGFISRMFKRLIVLALLGGVGYFIYTYFLPAGEPPWQVLRQKVEPQSDELKMPEPEPPPPGPPPKLETVVRASPKPRPAPQPAGPTFSLQVATCFFPACVESYRSVLEGRGHGVRLIEKGADSEALEIFSRTRFADPAEAEALAERVNREHRMEGHAYVEAVGDGYQISMGAFSDLARANLVKETLNAQFGGQIAFTTRLKRFSYALQTVLAGNFPSRTSAEQALGELRVADRRFADAFLVQNPVAKKQRK